MKKSFLTGLIIVLPLAITIWLLLVLVRFCTAPFTSIVKSVLSQFALLDRGFWIFSPDQVLHAVANAAVIIGLVAFLFFIGLVSRLLYLHLLVKGLERLIGRIPIVNRVYKACREFTDVLFSPSSSSFSRVVWAPFPTQKQGVLGLVTNTITITTNTGHQRPYVSVLIPGTPNPLVGFLLICEKKSLVFTDLSTEQSMKWVISCGSSQPEGLFKESEALTQKLEQKLNIPST
jgi:uncharacterized membrane protein